MKGNATPTYYFLRVLHNMKSEFHFLPHIYTFVTLITPSSENSSRIPLLKSLDPCFLMRVHQVRCEVTPCIQKHVDGHKEWNR